MKKILITGLVLMMVAGLSLAATAKSKAVKTGTAAVATGFFADLPQKDIQGKPIQYNKKIYLIDIWASWCPPCRMTIPELNRLQQKIGGSRFGVIGFSVDNTLDAVQSFSRDQSFAYPVAWLSKQQLEKFPPVRGIPTMFIVDSKGTILHTMVGYTPMEEMETIVKGFLGK